MDDTTTIDFVLVPGRGWRCISGRTITLTADEVFALLSAIDSMDDDSDEPVQSARAKLLGDAA